MATKRFIFRVFFACLFALYPFTLISPSREKIVAETANFSSSKAECVMEMRSRRVLYEVCGDYRLPMASTTKIATCITALELCTNLDEQFSIPKEAVGIEGSSVYLQEGQNFSVKELLYGLMLRSGNDCATALALHLCGSVENFSVKMNEIAEKSGALNSRFINPHGLPCENHYTTARDLAYITCYSLHNPAFVNIVSTQYYAPKNWKNKNKMLFSYEGAIGVKTGFTKQAGRCLVTAAKRGNFTLSCVVLNSPNMYERSSQLLDDAFKHYDYTKIVGANQPFTIADTQEKGKTGKDFYYPLLEEEKTFVEITTEKVNDKKNDKIIGKIQIYLAKRLLFSENLYKL